MRRRANPRSRSRACRSTARRCCRSPLPRLRPARPPHLRRRSRPRRPSRMRRPSRRTRRLRSTGCRATLRRKPAGDDGDRRFPRGRRDAVVEAAAGQLRLRGRLAFRHRDGRRPGLRRADPAAPCHGRAPRTAGDALRRDRPVLRRVLDPRRADGGDEDLAHPVAVPRRVASDAVACGAALPLELAVVPARADHDGRRLHAFGRGDRARDAGRRGRVRGVEPAHPRAPVLARPAQRHAARLLAPRRTALTPRHNRAMGRMSLCVYCASRVGHSPALAQAARQVGRRIGLLGWQLVYGGGRAGLMGELADAALAAGAHVIGVIPQSLMSRERGHTGLTELHVVPTMHERKRLMAERSDAFVALPGGLGTLEELFEAWTWRQLGYHDKPIGLLNVDGYYDALLAFVSRAVDNGYVTPQQHALLQVDSDPDELLRRLGEEAPAATAPDDYSRI